MAQYVPILVFLLVAVAFPFSLLAVASAVRPHRPVASKLAPYECGIAPSSDARGRQSVQYYIIAVLFVVFDVETVFLFPWAVRFKVLGLFGLVEMGVFLLILVAAYAYAWRKGALQWV
jgi:NADH-quinone oxidoreductase subunit A